MATKSRTPKNHIIKCESKHFNNVWKYIETFEMSKDGKGYKHGDTITYLESNSKCITQNNRSISVKIFNSLSNFNTSKGGYVECSISVKKFNNEITKNK